MIKLLLLSTLLIVNSSYSQTQTQVDDQKRIKNTRDVCDSMKQELNELKKIGSDNNGIKIDTTFCVECRTNEIKRSEVYLKGLSDYLKFCGGK